MAFIKFYSFRIRLISLFSILFIPLFAIIIYYTAEQKSKASEQASNKVLWVAQALANQQQYVESNTKQLLTILSQITEIKNIDTLYTSQLFSSILNQNPQYASLLLLDTNGNIIASGIYNNKINVSKRKYFTEVVKNRRFSIGEFVYSRLSKKPEIHFALPILNSDSSLRAVLVTSIDLNNYGSLIKLPQLSDDITYKFTDINGAILYHSPNIAVAKGSNERKDILLKYSKSTSTNTFVSIDNDGIARLCGLVRLKNQSNNTYMNIYAGIPEKLVYADYHKTLYIITIVVVVVFVLLLALAYFFSTKYIIKPIDQLLKSADLISEGNLETHTGIIKSTSELGELGTAIDQMTAKLRERDLEQKKVEKDLRKLKERFELAINSANIGIWDWHIRKNTLVWDKNMFELYNVDAEKFDYNIENWYQLIYPSDLDKFTEQLSAAIKLKQPFRNEFRIKHPKFGIKNIRIFADVILDKQLNTVRLIGVNWDITERKALEKQLHEAKEKVETNFKLKSANLANISHEIRTPIHGIIGFSQILKSADVTRDELIQYLNIIEESGNKLMLTMSNIIDFQLIEAGQLQLIRTESSIAEILSDVYQTVIRNTSTINPTQQIFLDTNNENIYLSIDKQRVSQILVTIIDHLKNISDDCDLHLGWEIDPNSLICYITITTDNTENIQSRLFEIDSAKLITSQNNLAGLSLALSNCLAEYMGGKIWTDSRDNIFRINLSLPIECNEVLVKQNAYHGRFLA